MIHWNAYCHIISPQDLLEKEGLTMYSFSNAAKPGDRGWAERLADKYLLDNISWALSEIQRSMLKGAFMAGYAARMVDEGAQLGNDDWPYFPPPWTGAQTKTCQMDGYLPVGDKGDESYWHCEEPGVAELNGHWLCNGHIVQKLESEPISPIQTEQGE